MKLSNKDIENHIKENQYRLMGLLDVEDDVFGELILNLKSKVKQRETVCKCSLNRKKNKSCICSFPRDIHISLALVQIGIRYCYDEEKFWLIVSRLISEVITEDRRIFLEKTFLETAKHYKFYYNNENKERMFFDNLKANILVSNYQIKYYSDIIKLVGKYENIGLKSKEFQNELSEISKFINHIKDDNYKICLDQLRINILRKLDEDDDSIIKDVIKKHIEILKIENNTIINSPNKDRIIRKIESVESYIRKFPSTKSDTFSIDNFLKCNIKENNTSIRIMPFKLNLSKFKNGINFRLKNERFNKVYPVEINFVTNDYILIKDIRFWNGYNEINMLLSSLSIIADVTIITKQIKIFNEENVRLSVMRNGYNKIVVDKNNKIEMNNVFVLNSYSMDQDKILEAQINDNSEIYVNGQNLRNGIFQYFDNKVN